MSIVIGDSTFDYYDLEYTQSAARFFDTARTVTGKVGRYDTAFIERLYNITVYCDYAGKNALLAQYLDDSTTTFRDEEGTLYNAYFLGECRPRPINPKGFNECNEFTVPVQLLVNGKT